MDKTFSASSIYKLFGSPTQVANLIYDTARESLLGRLVAGNKYAYHGVDNELVAFNAFCKSANDAYGVITHNTVSKIKYINGADFLPFVSATPDALTSEYVIDFKCPTNLVEYVEQCNEIKKEYFYQVQTQMFVFEKEKALLVNYLTRPRYVSECDYLIDANDKIFVHQINRDGNIISQICEKVKEYFPCLVKTYETFARADIISDNKALRLAKNDALIKIKSVPKFWEKYSNFVLFDNEYYAILT